MSTEAQAVPGSEPGTVSYGGADYRIRNGQVEWRAKGREDWNAAYLSSITVRNTTASERVLLAALWALPQPNGFATRTVRRASLEYRRVVRRPGESPSAIQARRVGLGDEPVGPWYPSAFETDHFETMSADDQALLGSLLTAPANLPVVLEPQDVR